MNEKLVRDVKQLGQSLQGVKWQRFQIQVESGFEYRLASEPGTGNQ